MKNYVLLIVLVAVFHLFIISCDDDDSDVSSSRCVGVSEDPIPSVAYSCSGATDCSDNTADELAGDIAVFWLNVGETCNAPGIPSNILAMSSGHLTPGDCTDGTCSGLQFPTVVWIDGEGESVYAYFCSGTYLLCGKIDTDNSGTFDSGEPYMSIEVATADGSPTSLSGGWNDLP